MPQSILLRMSTFRVFFLVNNMKQCIKNDNTNKFQSKVKKKKVETVCTYINKSVSRIEIFFFNIKSVLYYIVV